MKNEEFKGRSAYLSKFEDLEGKIIRIQYLIPPGEGIFKIYKNYILALENANYNILFTSSEKEDLGEWPFGGEDYLVNKSVVASGQLKAYGVSSMCPVTSNVTDEGKARNRRVEIVRE